MDGRRAFVRVKWMTEGFLPGLKWMTEDFCISQVDGRRVFYTNQLVYKCNKVYKSNGCNRFFLLVKYFL
uniref:Uncharacterized protein n=1 Tax=Helianthus annuus TaxID=4232 RepID=A0A251SV69_HELAN